MQSTGMTSRLPLVTARRTAPSMDSNTAISDGLIRSGKVDSVACRPGSDTVFIVF